MKDSATKEKAAKLADERTRAAAFIASVLTHPLRIHSLVMHVSASGLSRTLRFFVASRDAYIVDITPQVCCLLDKPFSEVAGGLVVRGCGTNFGEKLVDDLHGELSREGVLHASEKLFWSGL